MIFEWNVYIKDMNRREIKPYNIFKHGRFVNKIEELMEDFTGTKEEFATQVKSTLMYYFWSKCEWETVITSWPPRITQEELNRLNVELDSKYPSLSPRLETAEKIDVYQQVMLNWEHFINYLWGQVETNEG